MATRIKPPLGYQDIDEVTAINGPEVPDAAQDITAHRAFDTQRASDAVLMLSNAAADLNAATDELGDPIKRIEGALKRVAPGVSAWVVLATNDSTDDRRERSLGYAKVNGAWCLALRAVEGARGEPGSKVDTWPFREASRWMRAEAVCRLPDLLDKLLANVREMTAKMRKAAATASALADAVDGAGGEQ